MLFDELADRYGPYAAEVIRQALTLEEFANYEVEELVPYFETKAERLYEEYRSRLNVPPPADGPVQTQAAYLDILRRRWQESEELARLVLNVETEASGREVRALGA